MYSRMDIYKFGIKFNSRIETAQEKPNGKWKIGQKTIKRLNIKEKKRCKYEMKHRSHRKHCQNFYHDWNPRRRER